MAKLNLDDINIRMRTYQLTALFSLVFAVVGFSYNAWRMNESETNDTKRVAAFEMLKEASELEQSIFAAHYDQDPVLGNPRKGWVSVGLIVDLSQLLSPQATSAAHVLKKSWQENWEQIAEDQQAVDAVEHEIEALRESIKSTLQQLD